MSTVIEYMQQCRNDDTANVGGYDQWNLVYGNSRPQCTCKGFKYHKKCKHLTEALENACTWHEQFDGSPKEKGICPECGRKTSTVKVAV